jgi:hypothetical protein
MENCPVCYTPLESLLCAPCHDCGALPEELGELKNRVHKYREYEVFEELYLVFCDFCDVDFYSYDPDYFGLKKLFDNSVLKMNFVKEIENPQAEWNKYCPECQRRLKFLVFLDGARERHVNMHS